MMKTQFTKILYALVVAATLLGCNATTPPDEVAVTLFNALTSGDMQYVKENIYFANYVHYDAVCDYVDMAVKALEPMPASKAKDSLVELAHFTAERIM